MLLLRETKYSPRLSTLCNLIKSTELSKGCYIPVFCADTGGENIFSSLALLASSPFTNSLKMAIILISSI